MNTWWKDDNSENLWVEITDRSDLGKNIIAPKRAQQGKVTPGYELLKHVSEGDLVFHWWMRPKLKESRGFYGYSTVVGTMQEGVLPWKSRGRYASLEPEGEKPATFWNLDGFTEFNRPVLIGDINSKMPEILELLNEMEQQFGKPVYFPFCERQGKLAVNQTYFAKLPLAFLSVIKLQTLEMVEQDLTAAKNVTRIVPKNKRQSAVGFSRQMDPLKRIAVEKYAEDMVFNMLVDNGYQVERYGKPFDLLAVKGEEVLKVEVKGKSEYATSVEVTVNEVEVAKNQKNEYRTLLAVVDGIDLVNNDGKWTGSNGRLRLWWDLVFSEESLYPTKYLFTLPEDAKLTN
ncbi:Domain of unknown function DUF3883 [Candidatus Nanopelagicaceae bacterium]